VFGRDYYAQTLRVTKKQLPRKRGLQKVGPLVISLDRRDVAFASQIPRQPYTWMDGRINNGDLPTVTAVWSIQRIHFPTLRDVYSAAQQQGI
jgi:hypothetical protein